jgi:hypothetical protein
MRNRDSDTIFRDVTHSPNTIPLATRQFFHLGAVNRTTALTSASVGQDAVDRTPDSVSSCTAKAPLAGRRSMSLRKEQIHDH